MDEIITDLLERRARNIRLQLDEATDHIRMGRFDQAVDACSKIIVKADELKTLIRASKEG